jgi:hypothetical protein
MPLEKRIALQKAESKARKEASAGGKPKFKSAGGKVAGAKKPRHKQRAR